ncbi:MAG: glycosyltransferase family 4 protein [Methylocystis sp.]|nr:glycosyltransferase family 4 protein [Methylocystis sp.]
MHISSDIYQHIRRSKPKAVWIQGWQIAGYWEMALASRLMGAELWLRGETNLRSGAPSRRAIRGAALRALFKLVSRFLYIGAANRAFYLAHGASAERMVFAPYCVDNERFRLAAETHRVDREKIRRSFGAPEDAFVFLFVGKFVEKKRPLDLVAAAEALSALSPERKFHILWVGEGRLLEKVRMLCAARFAGASNVSASFAGFLNQSEITKAYCAADCIILPSGPDETWGLVVNEAMAAGVPAIISDACGCAADLVVPGHEELIYPMGDPEALARSMAAIMRRAPRAEEIARTIGRHDVRRTVEAVEALYDHAFG